MIIILRPSFLPRVFREYNDSPLSEVTRYVHSLPVVNGKKGLSHGPLGTGVAVGVMVAVAVGMAVLVGAGVGGMGVVVAQAVRTNKSRRERFFFMAILLVINIV